MCYNDGLIPLPENANIFRWISIASTSLALLFALIAMVCVCWTIRKEGNQEYNKSPTVSNQRHLHRYIFLIMTLSLPACIETLVGLLTPQYKIVGSLLTSSNVFLSIVILCSQLSILPDYEQCKSGEFDVEKASCSCVQISPLKLTALMFAMVVLSGIVGMILYFFVDVIGYDNASFYTGYFYVNTMIWDFDTDWIFGL
jgi:small-conductance mechanosensitive channel